MKIKIFSGNNLKINKQFTNFVTSSNLEIIKIESASMEMSKYLMIFYNETKDKSPLYKIKIIGPARQATVPEGHFNGLASRNNIIFTTISNNADAYHLYIIYEEKENI